MEVKILLIICFFIISILGTILHFTHKWLKRGILLHIFSAVNESTWEHMKLLVFPTVIVMVLQYILLREIYTNFFNSILVLYLVEVLAIPLLYESLHLIFKRIHFVITILIFYAAISLGIYAQYIILNSGISFFNEYVALAGVILLTILFGIFTYFPPKGFLFKDPVTGRYGDTGRHI